MPGVGAAACASASQKWKGPLHALRELQSGDVRDYVAWLVLGTGVLGGALALATLR